MLEEDRMKNVQVGLNGTGLGSVLLHSYGEVSILACFVSSRFEGADTEGIVEIVVVDDSLRSKRDRGYRDCVSHENSEIRWVESREPSIRERIRDTRILCVGAVDRELIR